MARCLRRRARLGGHSSHRSLFPGGGQIPTGGGQLGDGTNTASNVPVAVARGLTFQSMSADIYHSCGVTDGERQRHLCHPYER